MKTTGLVLGAVLLSGCAAVSLPPDAASIALVAVSSSAVEVHRPRFRMKDGGLKLEACITREFKGETTADSHIDIVYLDASGRQLAQERSDVTPHTLPQTMRMPRPHAYLLIPVRPPSGTAKIEVRADESAHRP